MTATATRTDVDVDVGLPLVCEAQDGCRSAAAWLGTAVHARGGACATFPFCDACRERYLTWIVGVLRTWGYHVCTPHKTAVTIVWRPL